MAFILSGEKCSYANIDYPVGLGAPNKHDDVALVQGLLMTWTWQHILDGPKSDGANTIDINTFKLDGRFGHETHVLLRTFTAEQRVSLKSPGWVMPLHIKRYKYKTRKGGFDMACGEDALLELLVDTPLLMLGTDMVDSARGKYQRNGVFCLGWQMPPFLAVSLSHHRGKALYHHVP